LLRSFPSRSAPSLPGLTGGPMMDLRQTLLSLLSSLFKDLAGVEQVVICSPDKNRPVGVGSKWCLDTSP